MSKAGIEEMSSAAIVESGAASARGRIDVLRDYINLLKLRMGFLAALIAVAGYYMGANDPISVVGMLHAFFGTYLISAGAFILNMYMEREFDLRMKRTRNRPLPAGRLAPASAFAFGMLVSFGGIIYLLAFTNIMAAAAGAVGLGSYVFIYTPMKRISHLNTLIGSFPGAIPPIPISMWA